MRTVLPLDSKFTCLRGLHWEKKKKKEQESHHLIKTQILKSLKLYFQLKAGFLIFLANTKAERSIKKYLSFKVLGGQLEKIYSKQV